MMDIETTGMENKEDRVPRTPDAIAADMDRHDQLIAEIKRRRDELAAEYDEATKDRFPTFF